MLCNQEYSGVKSRHRITTKPLPWVIQYLGLNSFRKLHCSIIVRLGAWGLVNGHVGGGLIVDIL